MTQYTEQAPKYVINKLIVTKYPAYGAKKRKPDGPFANADSATSENDIDVVFVRL